MIFEIIADSLNGNDADSDEVLKALYELAINQKDVLKDPAPSAVVNNFRDFGVEYSLRLFADNDKYWDVLYMMQNKVLQLVKEKGYKIATSTAISVEQSEK